MTCCAPGAGRGDEPDLARPGPSARSRGRRRRRWPCRSPGRCTSRSRSAARSLSHDLLLDGDVVGKDHHVTARVERVGRLGERVLPRHRDQRQARPRPAGRAQRCPRRLRGFAARLARPVGASARCRRPRGRWPATRRRRPRSRRAGRLDPPVAGAARPRPASRSRFSSVPIATIAACTPATACALAVTCISVTESA